MSLIAENLKRSAKSGTIVDDVSFTLDTGEIGALLGPSGGGKSSLLRLIMGLDTLDSGRLTLGGRVIAGDGHHAPAERRGASMVFQDFTLFPHLSVQENIDFAPKRAEVARADIVDMLEIGHLMRRSIANLSGGEQQRVALARALASGPGLLLLDEPFSNIDNMLKDRVYERVLQYLRHVGTTVILATHDHDEAFFFGNKILVMKDGRLIDSNTPEGIYQRPANLWVANFFGVANVVSREDLAQMGKDVADGEYLLRPEMLALNSTGMPAVLEQVTFFGPYYDLKVRSTSGTTLRIRTQQSVAHAPGDTVHLGVHSGVTLHRMARSEVAA